MRLGLWPIVLMDRVAPCGALQALPPLLDAIGETARIAVQSTDPATIRVLAWRLLPQVHRLSGQDCCVSAAEFVWKHSDQQPLPSARRRVRRRRPARMARICIGMAWMSSLS